MIDLGKMQADKDIKRKPCAEKFCPSTQYKTPIGWLCTACDDTWFEGCLDCGLVAAWCSCAGNSRSAIEMLTKKKEQICPD